MTLAEVQEDLRIHPAQVIHLEDMELNGIANGHMEQGAGTGKTVDHMIFTAQHKQHGRVSVMFDSVMQK